MDVTDSLREEVAAWPWVALGDAGFWEDGLDCETGWE
jgi:hypothetical protein